MIVSTHLSLGKIVKNSFFLVSLGIKNSLWTLLTWIVVVFFIIAFPLISMFIIPFWPFSFICFVGAFNCYPVIRKYVIQPYYDALGQDNPEFDYLKTGDSIFEDRGAEEPAPEKPVKKSKPKTIS
jgi:hypothetical protein